MSLRLPLPHSLLPLDLLLLTFLKFVNRRKADETIFSDSQVRQDRTQNPHDTPLQQAFFSMTAAAHLIFCSTNPSPGRGSVRRGRPTFSKTRSGLALRRRPQSVPLATYPYPHGALHAPFWPSSPYPLYPLRQLGPKEDTCVYSNDSRLPLHCEDCDRGLGGSRLGQHPA